MTKPNTLTIKFPYNDELVKKYFERNDPGFSGVVTFHPNVSEGDHVTTGSIIGFFRSNSLNENDSRYRLSGVYSPTKGKVVWTKNDSEKLSGWDPLIAIDVGQSFNDNVIEEKLSQKAVAEVYWDCQKARFGIMFPLVQLLLPQSRRNYTEAKKLKWP